MRRGALLSLMLIALAAVAHTKPLTHWASHQALTVPQAEELTAPRPDADEATDDTEEAPSGGTAADVNDDDDAENAATEHSEAAVTAEAAAQPRGTRIDSPVEDKPGDGSGCAEKFSNRTVAAMPLYVGSQWNEYRIGDVFLYGDRYVDVEGARGGPPLIRTWPAGSLLTEYWMHSHGPGEYDTLADLVLKQPIPARAETWCTLHVRLGDVAECEAAPVSQMLATQIISRKAQASGGTIGCPHVRALFENQTYIRPLIYWTTALDAAGGVPSCPDVHIVSGSKDDLGPVTPKSHAYLAALAQHLCERGYTPHLRLGHSPDEDFAIFARSRVFLSSGGGMSRLVQALRQQPRMKEGVPPPQHAGGTEQQQQRVGGVGTGPRQQSYRTGATAVFEWLRRSFEPTSE